MKRLGQFTSLAIAAGLALPLWAQDPNQIGGDTPEPGVARISLLSGDVSVRRGDSGELVAAELNAPLVEKDHLSTAIGSRAEIQFDYANMIRISPDSEVRLGQLLDGDYLIQVALGTATFRVLRDTSSLAEISTPTVSVRPLQKGSYRVTVRADGSTQVTVRSGEAEIFTPGGSEILRAGQTMEARGAADNPEFMISSAIPRDEWDRWNENRDNDLNRSRSYQYVSSDIYGADDLDNYGRWVYDAPYGNVWVPNVASGWAPYRVGRWVNVNYYGWTWLSGDPWGWAPYHWGNWYYTPSWGWAWYPGAIGPRYYWRPAMVSFFGWGARSGLSIGIGVGFNYGYVGWVPLAPFEVYRPWFGRGARNNITIVNNVNIVNNYRNARFVNGRNGVTGIDVGQFGKRRTDLNNFARANDRDLQRGGESRGRLPIEGGPESRRFNDRQVAQNAAPRSNRQDGDFVMNPGRSRGGNPIAGGGQAAATATGAVATAPTSRGRGEPRAAAPAPQTTNPGTINGSGWRRMDSAARSPDAASPDAVSRGGASLETAPGPSSNARSRGGFVEAPRDQASQSRAPRASANANAAPNNGGGTVGGGWRRFDPNTNSGTVLRSEPRQSAVGQSNSPVGSNARARGSEPVRIAPDIVQPRAPRDTGRVSNGGANSGSGGGIIQRAPRAPSTPQPQISTPRPSRSAPSAPSAPSINRGNSGNRASSGGSSGGTIQRAPRAPSAPTQPQISAPRPSRSAPSAPSAPSINRGNGGSRASSGGGGGPVMSRSSGGGGGGGAVRSGGSGGGGGAPRGAAGGSGGGTVGGRRR